MLHPPERLNARHDVSAFDNGRHESLDQWLRERALASEELSARTYVVCAPADAERVVGYYTISAAMEQRLALPSAKLKRNMPDRVPLLLIGRLAVDLAFQGRGLGSSLLSDALRRCAVAAEIAGARAIIVQALDDQACDFYRKHGFRDSPLGERTLLMPIEVANALLDIQ